MVPLPANPTSLRRLRRAAHAACLTTITLACLLGCADTHWQRAFYQGATYGSEQCKLKHKPNDAPCGELTDYESYERERSRAKNEVPPAARINPIENQQR